MSSGFVLSSDEMEALSGVPDQDFRMYVLMRYWMNYATGLVGDPRDRLVSYRRLREHMEVVPERGSKMAPAKRTDDALRASVARLVRRGLLKAAGETFSFCYRLPMALVRPNEEPRMNHACEPRMNPAENPFEFQRAEAFSCQGEPRAGQGDEPQPSVYLSDRDEMVAGAREDAVGEVAPTDAGGVAGVGLSATGQVADFRRLLGDDGLPSSNVIKACSRVAEVKRQREVSTAEMQAAIADARLRSAGNVAGYAAAIIANGSLLAPPPGAKVVSIARRQPSGLDGVFSVLEEAFGS
ncbi:hypothetical protein JW897_12210 [Chromobacterium alkanivorans]|uniref:hypothetical protein n=1 Tax=Chromobacterium alkanivorans TaxID=1071719 RepID=UPI00196790FC|nr:hypothetical protein [Chromobacterium alkanivorans]MBN3004499.1 hypothetical protein [Chromobacterium alkanivorans]